MADLNERIDEITDRIADDLIEVRRAIHRHPELAFEEHETSARVAAELRKAGLAPQTGVGATGVITLVEGAASGPTIGVRGDMDALPIQEASGLPFASEVAGRSHACGHDAHTAIALGVARVVHELRSELKGRLKLFFQPAEETLMGAKAMIADGALEDPRPDYVIGYHNWPPLPAGTIGYLPGTAMASSDSFDITLRGKAGHGAHPHQGIDAIVGAAAFVSQLQSVIAREVAPMVPAVVTVGQMNAGTARNVIAAEAVLRGSARTLDAAAAKQVEIAVRRMLSGIGTAMRLEVELTWTRVAPVVENNPTVLACVIDAAREIVGKKNVSLLPGPSMGSEDFGWFMEAVPGAHLRIGSKIDGLETAVHNANYNCNDLAITTGVRAIARAVFALAEQQPRAR
jgi:amidohydrolase